MSTFAIIITILLSVPFLNMLVGGLMGLSVAVHMLRTGRFERLLMLAGVAGVWSLFAFVQLASIIERNFFGHWLIWTIPVAGFAALFMKLTEATGKKGFEEQLAKANAEGKGVFSRELGFGCVSEGVVVLFDPTTRHVAFLTETSHRVEPIAFIKGWELNWTEVNGGFRNVRMKISTTDFDNPVYYASTGGKANGDVWFERMDNLINRAAASA